MKTTRTQNLLAAVLISAGAFTTTVSRAADSLPSWNDGKAKQSIIAFVGKVTKEGTPDFVPVAEREWAYDRKSPIGTLDKALDEAQKRGWTVVSMKNDWKRIFAFEQ